MDKNKKILIKRSTYFKHIQNPTFELCQFAVNLNPYNIQYINKNITGYDELFKLAVEKEPFCVIFSFNRDNLNELLNKNGLIIHLIYNPNEEQIYRAIKQNGMAIKIVKNPNEELCNLAIQSNPMSIKYIKHPSNELCMKAIELNYYSIKYIKYPTNDMYINVLKRNGVLIFLIKNKTLELWKYAIIQNPLLIQNFMIEDIDLDQLNFKKYILEIFEQNNKIFLYLPNKYKFDELCNKAFFINPLLFNTNYIYSKYNKYKQGKININNSKYEFGYASNPKISLDMWIEGIKKEPKKYYDCFYNTHYKGSYVKVLTELYKSIIN